ncbi:hypothetical protein MMP65_19370 [Acinetobacter sp. ANC 3926]|uniref:hypothetical protein n=1 Tax=Acinetobacter genomosp. 15BJ TaxID=106651 RepID=UPI001F4B08E6|nr:hypothetical protein [Acinetobacter genomosp. 15BJ]MCH7293595.1 hypothetical protein [Acinetobacter genomosp. 15BJ]
MDSKTIRYNNTRILVDQVGGVSNFANKINKGQSQTSQFAGTTPIKGIGNKVAREIEDAFEKPHGWLDVLHQEDSNFLSNNLNAPPSVVSNKELEALFKSLIYLDSQGKLSTDLIKALKTIVNSVN